MTEKKLDILELTNKYDMTTFKDTSTKFRFLQVLRAIMEEPNKLTINQLAERYQITRSTIKNYFEEFKNAGFEIKYDEKYRYAITADRTYEYLNELLFFSEKDQRLMVELLQKAPTDDKQKERIARKLESIYDFTRLGSHLISNQFITKIDRLEQGKQAQKIVQLINYRSTNSNTVENKLVEPFHIMPKEDILHGYDIEQRTIRHYRIARIERVEVTETPWQYGENYHNIMATDPFRISESKQERVRIRMQVGGYNELIERFPLTYGYISKSADQPNVYELDCMVNHCFYGITNFILGSHHNIIEVLEPESLLDHIREEVKKINF